jgi:cytochrome P450
MDSILSTLKNSRLARISLLLCMLYLYNRKKDAEDEEITNGIPGSRGMFPIIDQTWRRFVYQNKTQVLRNIKQYGPVYRTRFLGQNIVVVSGNTLANYVLCNDDIFTVKLFEVVAPIMEGFLLFQNGMEHKRNRGFVVKALSNSQLQENLMEIAEVFTQQVNEWAARESGVEIYTALKTAIMKVMLKVLFGNSKVSEEETLELVKDYETFGRGATSLVSFNVFVLKRAH